MTDSKLRARDLFLGPNELPKPGGRNPLREAWNGGYGVEVFYFAASSLKITNILRSVKSALIISQTGVWYNIVVAVGFAVRLPFAFLFQCVHNLPYLVKVDSPPAVLCSRPKGNDDVVW